jgi:2,3-bisphosphoglycerate-dependent phosphoglycerate mutase
MCRSQRKGFRRQGKQVASFVRMVYEFEDDMKPIRRYYLGNPEKVKKAMEAVAGQASAKRQKS